MTSATATPSDDLTTAEIAKRFLNVETGHICDALEHLGILTPVLSDRFRPLTQATRFAGPAITLKLSLSRTSRESRHLNDIVEGSAEPGHVVVVDAAGFLHAAVFGDRAGFVAKRSGAVAAIINGGSRDVRGLDELGLPVHGVGRSLPASEGRFAGRGINSDLILDGVYVQAGDWLVGDESGICVIPKDLTLSVLALAEEREEIDKDSVRELKAGKTLREVHRHFKDDDIEHLHETE
jgi:4-hydroxy-4-methyl-2-oxoglutarate aldolase